jgi:molybdopterin-guanine dinucleotide biosynthesis protein A
MDNMREHTPYIISVCGLKNSGKTTYAGGVIRVLKLMGYKVAAFKHDAHDFEPDVPGTDSWSFGRAGADSVAVYSGSRYMITQKTEGTKPGDMLPFVADHDVVLIEGDKLGPYPKIAIVREGIASEPVTRDGLLAVATDTSYKDQSVITLDLNDYVAAAALIAKEAGNPKDRATGLFGSAAILGGGQSSRMGFDKKLITVNGNSLLESMAGRLAEHFDDVFVVTNDSLPDQVNIDAVPDKIPGMGPPSGFHAAISRSKSRYVFLIACDMPHINNDYIDLMMQMLGQGRDACKTENPGSGSGRNVGAGCDAGYDALLTRQGDFFEPFHAFYGKSLLPGLAANLLRGNSSVKSWLDANNVCYVSEDTAKRYTPDWKLFENLNTPEAYREYLDSL